MQDNLRTYALPSLDWDLANSFFGSLTEHGERPRGMVEIWHRAVV